jgi:hypothetical protein
MCLRCSQDTFPNVSWGLDMTWHVLREHRKLEDSCIFFLEDFLKDSDNFDISTWHILYTQFNYLKIKDF